MTISPSFDSALSTRIGSKLCEVERWTVYVPNVVGDWAEYEDHAGLRVRVHGLEPAEPPRGRDEAAAGLKYFCVRITVENRGTGRIGVQLEDGQVDIRIGPDGEAAFLDWRNSQFIEGFDVYPLRRATAVLYAAGAEARLAQVDVQVHLRADEDWTERRLWTGGLDAGLADGPADTDADAEAGAPSGGPAPGGLAGQVSDFLRRRTEPGTN